VAFDHGNQKSVCRVGSETRAHAWGPHTGIFKDPADEGWGFRASASAKDVWQYFINR